MNISYVERQDSPLRGGLSVLQHQSQEPAMERMNQDVEVGILQI